MNLNMYQILQWSAEAQLEQDPKRQLNRERMDTLQSVCEMIDHALEYGNAVEAGAEIDRNTGEPVIYARFPGLFLQSGNKSEMDDYPRIRILK